MSQLEQPVVYYLRFVWVTKATVHTHLQEKRPAVTSRDDHSKADLSCLLTAHQRNVDVTLLWFFQGLLAQAWLSSNQECDQVDSKGDPITHSNHIMGGKWEKGTSCHTSIYVLGFFFCNAISLQNIFCFYLVSTGETGIQFIARYQSHKSKSGRNHLQLFNSEIYWTLILKWL